MRRYFTISVFVLALFCMRCDDILVEDISEECVTVLAPADSISTDLNIITFWWEEIDGATAYELQVVSPSFELVEQLILDSLVADDKFELSPVPGEYEWRVRGVNTEYETKFTTYSLTIDSTLNLAQQQVNLLLPVDNFVSGQTSIVFTWDVLANAEQYDFSIEEQGVELVSFSTASTTATHDFDADGTFVWKVRAINASSETLFSSHIITIDTTLPAVPQLTFPADGDTLNVGQSLQWQNDQNDATAISDAIFIYDDMEGTNLVLTGTSLTSSFEVTDELGSNKKYYWEIQSTDAAGNVSGISELREFFLEE